jgi:hypothetical protein
MEFLFLFVILGYKDETGEAILRYTIRDSRGQHREV